MKNLLKLFLIFIFSIFVLNIFNQKAYATSINPSNLGVVANASIHDIIVDGNQAYISGNFTRIGPNIGQMAMFDSSTYSLIRQAKPNGNVNKIISDGGDGWYIGGSFTKIGDHATKRVARINNNGTVDTSFVANVNNTVSDLLLHNSKLFISGSFTSIGGAADNRIYIGAISPSTGALDAWYPGSQSNPVTKLAVYENNIYWYISNLYYIYRANNTNGTKDNAWSITLNSSVLDWHFENDYLYLAGGNFTTLNGNACSGRFTKVRISDLTIDPLNFSLNNTVRKIFITGNSIYLAGDFTSVLATTRNRFAKVDIVESLPVLQALNPNINDKVHTFLINGNNLYLGGEFTTVSGTSRLGFADYDLSNLQLNAWNPGVLNGTPSSINIYGSKVFIGGTFASMDLAVRNRLASYNTSTGVISSWAPYTDGATAYQILLAQDANNIYIGGRFKEVNGVARCNIGVLSKSTGALQSLNKKVSQYSNCPNYDNGQVYSMHINNGVLYVGGDFAYADGVGQTNFVAFNTTDGSKINFTPTPNGLVRAINTDSNKLYLGGAFTTISGQTRNRFAEYNISDYTLTDFNPSFTDGNNVFDINFTNDKMFVSGSFTKINGSTCKNFSAFNKSDNSQDTNWCFNFTGVYSTYLYSTTILGGNIYIAGTFDAIGGSTRYNLASFKLSDATLNSWSPNARKDLIGQIVSYKIASTNQAILASGNFDTVNAVSSSYFVQFDIPKISFSKASHSASESSTSYNIVLNSSFAPEQDITVEYYVSGGTATLTDDYALADGTATISANTTSTNISLSIVNDEDAESTETIIIGLRNPTNSILGTITNFTYSIEDDDAEATFFSLSNVPSEGEVSSAINNITLTVRDQLGVLKTDYRGTVNITSSDLTATLPASYTFTEADNGVHSFSGFSFSSVGNKTVTFTDNGDVAVTVTTDNILIKPGSITDLTCDPLYTFGRVNLSWTVPSGVAESGNIYSGQRRAGATISWNQAGNVSFGTAWPANTSGQTVTKEISGLSVLTGYSFAMKVLGNDDIESNISNIVTCITRAPGSPQTQSWGTTVVTSPPATTPPATTPPVVAPLTTIPTQTTVTTLPNTTTTRPNTTTTTLPTTTTTIPNTPPTTVPPKTVIETIGTIPQPAKPVESMNQNEVKEYTITLQEYVLDLLKYLVQILTNPFKTNIAAPTSTTTTTISQPTTTTTSTTTTTIPVTLVPPSTTTTIPIVATTTTTTIPITTTTTTTTTVPQVTTTTTLPSSPSVQYFSVGLIADLGPIPSAPKSFSSSSQTEIRNYLDLFWKYLVSLQNVLVVLSKDNNLNMTKIITNAGPTPSQAKSVTTMTSTETEAYVNSLQQYLVNLLQEVLNELKAKQQ